MTHKIHFEHKELQAMHETEIFLVKYRVMEKAANLFGSASEDLKKVILEFRLPEEVDEKRAKIFKGENYLHLPYVVMDYPALFGKENVFAFRTMFWWGNFFSFTLQLSGMYLENFESSLKSNYSILSKQDYYFCINSTPWQYHYHADNYMLLGDVLKNDSAIIEKQISERNFIKLSRKIKISEWDNVSIQCAETFRQLMLATGMKRR